MKFYLCIVLLFSLFSPSYGSNLIPNDKCALVLASRFSLSEAKDYIRTEILDRSSIKIYFSDDGWYVIATGLLNKEKAKEEITNLKSNGKIPEDSYCSKGSRFIQEIKLDNNLNYIFKKKSKFSQEKNSNNDKSWQKLDHYKVKDGVAIDVDTGLMWMRCSIDQKWTGSTCSGKSLWMNWDEIMKIPDSFEYAGFSDWHVPTHKELLSLRYCSSGRVKKLRYGETRCEGIYDIPTIVQSVFPNTSEFSFVWSSSPYANSSNFAWGIYFNYGYDSSNSRNNYGQVRLVRSGQ